MHEFLVMFSSPWILKTGVLHGYKVASRSRACESMEIINFMIAHKIFVQMYGMEKYILKMLFKNFAASIAGNKLLLFFFFLV